LWPAIVAVMGRAVITSNSTSISLGIVATGVSGIAVEARVPTEVKSTPVVIADVSVDLTLLPWSDCSLLRCSIAGERQSQYK